MKDFISEQLAQIKLKHTPLTGELLEKFVTNKYEGTVELNEENLKAELLDLYQRDNLDKLITAQLNPITRKLLENYITYEYEGTIRLTEENLKLELNDLTKRGHLGAIISAEWVYSKTRFQEESRELNFKSKKEESKYNNYRKMKKELKNKVIIFEEYKTLALMSTFIRKENYKKVIKEFKFLFLKEDGTTIGFTNSSVKATHFPLEPTLNKMQKELYSFLHDVENDLGELIKKYLEFEGINLPEGTEIVIE